MFNSSDNKNALIIVDLQNDFCQGGSLAVPDADAIVSLANQLQPYFDVVVATQDWHPKDHLSFASNHLSRQVGDQIMLGDILQVLWSDHCVQGTRGAEFHPLLNLSRINNIIYKGIDKKIDSYSAFFDNAHLRSTGLGEYLRDHAVSDIYIMGLATDYCVKYSCLDALKLDFSVYMIADACRGIDLQIGNVASTLQELMRAGVTIIQAQDIAKHQLVVE